MPVECPPLLAGLPKHSLTAFEPCAALFLGLLTCGQITRPDVLLPESHRNPDRFRLGPHGANESRRECDPLHTGYGTATLPWSVANWAGRDQQASDIRGKGRPNGRKWASSVFTPASHQRPGTDPVIVMRRMRCAWDGVVFWERWDVWRLASAAPKPLPKSRAKQILPDS